MTQIVALCTVLWVLGCSTYAIEIPPEVPRPPRITQQPDEVTYAIPQIQIVLRCSADGQPGVSTENGYRWEKDGKPLDVYKSGNNSIVMSGNDGTIQFMGSEEMSEQAVRKYAGVYQCFASNELGTAMSNEITLKVAQSPYQRPKDEGRYTRLGQPMFLPCNFVSRPGQTITWAFIPDAQLSDRISQTAEGGLVFSHITADEDNLRVFCNAKDLATRKSTDGTHYILHVNMENPLPDRQPDIVSPQDNPETQIHLKGETLTLKCSATGKPTPSIEWSKLSGAWPTDRYTVKDYGQTVVIKNATYSDTGDYRCTASNYVGITSVTTSIQIQSRPFFASEKDKPRDVFQTPGGSVEIRCDVDGLPVPETVWKVNGIPIEDTEEMTNREVSSDVISLTDLKAYDSAVYQCVASNVHGTLISQAFVNVLTRPPIPLSSNKPDNQQVIGKSIDLECRVFGSPPPTISWLPLVEVPSERLQLMNDNSTLRINTVNSSDAGSYQCQAVNEYGSVEVDFALEVLQATQIIPADGPTQYGELGKPFSMLIEVVSDERLQPEIIRWEKNGEAICAGVTCELRRLSFADAGDYTISVSTPLDVATATINLIVRGKPNAPPAFNYVTNTDPLTLDFSWESPDENNAPIEEYKIEYEEDQFSPGMWQVLKEGIPPTQISTSVDLSPFVNYQFRVVARNVVGWGKKSKTVGRYQTPAGAPLVNPTGVNGKGTKGDNMLITWEPVKGIDQNGPEFGYIVSYCLAKTCNADGPWMTADVGANDDVYEVRETPVYEKYRIKVRSVNAEGEAPEPEVAIGYSGESTPIAYPLNVIVDTDEKTPTVAQLSWQPVAAVDVQGRLRGYQIEYRRPGREWNQITVGNVTSSTIEDLTPYGLYEFVVSVFNNLAAGRRSEIVQKRMPESVPGAPTNLRVEDKTATSLLLNWDSPNETNGVITGYVFTYMSLNNTSENSNEIQLSEPRLKIESLTPQSVYQITVAAETARGVGPEKAVLNTSTFEAGVPGPVDFNVEVEVTNITIKWEKPRGLPADTLSLEIRRSGTDEWERVGTYPSEPKNQDVVFSGLEPLSSYDVRVVVANPYGENEMTAIVITTGGTAINQGSVTEQVWFIVVVALVALLIIALAIACLLRKRKGGKYSVSDKEGRLSDPESNASNRKEVGEYNEEKEEVKKPLAAGVPSNGDATSTPSNGVPLLSRTRGDSVGGDSIDAFADAEAREFNEDGSFIGQYGNMESTNNSAATSPGVEEQAENYRQTNGDAV